MPRLNRIILANPAAGQLQSAHGRYFLGVIAAQLKCPVIGLDTRSREEFRICIRETAKTSDIVLVAGGDGTFSEVMTFCEEDVILGFLPFGSGNALKQALGIPRGLTSYLKKVLRKEYSFVGVILCNGFRKVFQASVGMEGLVVREQQFIERFVHSQFFSYVLALIKILISCKRTALEAWVDDRYVHIPRSLTTIISKHPFYGYGLMINQAAHLADEYLYVRSISTSFIPTLALAVAAFLKRQAGGVFLGAGK